MPASSPRSPALLLLLLLGAACSRGPGAEHDPRPQRLVPARGARQVAVPVRIEGENFQPLAVRQLSGGAPVRLDQGFGALLGDTALEQVEWVDAQTLRARVPAGLAPGAYTLTVVSPLGRRVQLERAFQVSATAFAQLSASSEVDRLELLVGQEAEVSLHLENAGDAPARDVVAALQVEGAASVVALDAPVGELAPGARLTRRWRVQGTAQGALALRFGVAGTDAESGLALEPEAPAARTLQVFTPAALVAQGALTLQQVSMGQELEASLAVLNEGGSAALGVQPQLQSTGEGSVEVLQSPAPEDLPGGALRTFRWRLRATQAGVLDVLAQAQGSEALSGAALTTGPAPAGALRVQWPAALVGSVASSLPQVSVGQPFSASLTVRNAGEALARGVLPTPPQLSGAGGAQLLSSPAPQDVPGGAQATFTWGLLATGAGPLTLSTGAQGTDANSAAAVETGPLAAPAVQVQRAAALRAVARVSAERVTLGQALQVELEVFNDGEADALAVLPAAPFAQGRGDALTMLSAVTTPVTVPGGASRLFTWSYLAAAPGDVLLTTLASGRDANSGLPVDSGAVQTPSVRVQAPAALSATLSASAQVSTGQRFVLTLAVRNDGGADAVDVLPGLPALSGTASATLAASPTPASAALPAGEVRTFGWEYVATQAGTLRFEVEATGADANSGAALAAPASVQLVAERAAALVGSLVTPGRVDVAQPFDVTLTVENTGEAAALGVLPDVPGVAGSAAVQPLSAAPVAQDIPGGERRSFTWSYRATGPGDLTFVVQAQGTDAHSGAGLSTGPVTDSLVEVQTPAALSGTAIVAPGQVSVGQLLWLELTVSNAGQADALGVQPALHGLESSSGPLSLVSAPSADTVPGGGSHVFRWTFAAVRAGSVALEVEAQGTDANSGALVATGAVGVPAVRVQTPAALVAQLGAPAQLSVGQTFSVSLEVLNAGEATALEVTPTLPLPSGAGEALLVTGPLPASVSLGAGQRHTFTWQYTATRAGSLRLESGAAGRDANSGDPLVAPAPAPADLTVQRPAALTAALELEPGVVNVGQLVTVSLTVQNTGEAAAQAVVPQPPVLVGPGGAQLSAGPLPASVALPGGARQVFTWQYTATAAGALSVRTAATGSDANSGAALSSPSVTQSLTVQRPAQLVATLSASPSTVDEAQTVTLTLQVSNAGETAALNVTASLPVPSGSPGTLLTSAAPAPVTLAGGASHTFTWTWRAGSSGGLVFSASASGTDANTGAAASTGQLSTATVGVQQAPALVGSLVATPATVNEGQPVTLAYTVQNTGEATANAVTPQAPVLSGTSSALLLTAPSPVSVALAGGASHTFSWVYRVGSAGSLAFTTRALAQGANTSAALQSADASAAATVQQPAALVGALSAPARVSQGQAFTLTLGVTNAGQSGAQAVTPAPPLLSGTGGATLVSGPTPAAVNLAAGATQVFTWQYTAGAAGPLTFSTSASGTDATSGGPLGTGTLSSAPLAVQQPAALVATLGAAPASVSVGQTLTVTLSVQNPGGAQALSVSPGPLTLEGTGAATLLSGPTPGSSNIAGGASRTFSWQYTATASGTLRFTAGAQGTDANSGAPLAAAPVSSAPLAVQRPAALVAQLGASQPVVNAGQLFTVTLTAQNTGEAAAAGVVPAPPTLSGTSTATRVSGPTPASATLPGGQSQAFTWQYRAGPAGDLGFASSVTGADANTGTAVGSAQAATPSIAVLQPASLAASLTAPLAVSVGQEFTLTLGVTNTGGSSATNVMPGSPGASGTAGVTLVSGPTPASVSLPGAGSQDFRWTWRAASTGSVTFQVGASGTDATDGQSVSSALASSGSVSVQPPATLVSSLSSPPIVGLGETFTVTMTVRNDGAARATNVVPSPLAQLGTATAALVSGPTPSSTQLQGGQSKDFTWKFTASTEGSLALSGNATGTDANSGASLLSLVSGATSTFIRRATEVASDPFGDGTSFAYVFSANGLLHLGPNKTGTGGVRSNADGSAPQSFSFSFPKDVTGTHDSDNALPGPFPSIGSAGCAADTLACGPDNEAGRGLFFTGRVGGQDWLGIVGAHPTNKVTYVYLTPDTDAVLDFRYVDMNYMLTGTVEGVTAARLYGSALYMGMGDSGGNRPALFALKQLPAIPGLDITTTSQGMDLGMEKFPYLGSHGTPANTASMAMVDAMAEFHGRLYLANNGGCARSTRVDPRSYKDFPSDWADCRPNVATYTARSSVTVPHVNALEPADKAVPQLIPFGERLYMARNTTLGPQLFACAPEATGSGTDCDPGDWSLVAPNSVGDAQLTQFDMPDNARITLLAATASHLYVGFNNASAGLVIFRTANPTAKLRSDFRGLLDCPADQATSTCQGLGQNGLGVGATRIFDGVALTFDARNYLYLTAGTGTGPVRVYRIAD